MASFKVNFKELREKRRIADRRRQLPIIEISDHTGLSRLTLARYENGERLKALDAGSVVALMRYFNVPFEELVTIYESDTQKVGA